MFLSTVNNTLVMAENSEITKLQVCDKISLLSLSDEVLLMICKFLRGEDRIILSNVCCRFERILLDKTLCRNIDMSSKHDGSCLKCFGMYLRKRRNLICSINIANCDWIPVPKLELMTKNLSHLQVLNVLNIYMPVKVLSKVFLESKQLRELSWSWRGDSKDDSWSQAPKEVRSSLAGLKRLHISIGDPSEFAVHEFVLNLCNGLTHLIIQVDLSLGKVENPKVLKACHFGGPTKLQSLVVFKAKHELYLPESGIEENDRKLSSLLIQLMKNAGKLSGGWECLWINDHNILARLKRSLPSQIFSINPNMKSLVLLMEDVEKIKEELAVTSLVLLVPADTDVIDVRPLSSFAPHLQRFSLDFRTNLCDYNFWVVSALQTSELLIELSLFGVHYCKSVDLLESFWDAIKSLRSLKKLAVSPCVLPRVRHGKVSTRWDVSNFVVTYGKNAPEIIKDVAEMLQLNALEEFEVGQFFTIRTAASDYCMLCERGDWIPYIPVISIWTNLTSLAFDSIFSLAHLHEFKLVAKACTNLSSLRFRNIETKGYCGYVKNVANALPLCKALKYFRLDEYNIADYLKDLLIGLSQCSGLEAIYITTNEKHIANPLKAAENLSEIILNLINKCHLLYFMQVPLPNAHMKTCNKLKNWLNPRLTPSRRVTLKMEFCSWRMSSGNTYHSFPPSGPRIEQMQWNTRVAQTPLFL